MFLEEAEDYVIWNCSLCVSRDVSIRNGQVKRPFLFALREQGCFSGRTKRTEKMLVRSA